MNKLLNLLEEKNRIESGISKIGNEYGNVLEVAKEKSKAKVFSAIQKLS